MCKKCNSAEAKMVTINMTWWSRDRIVLWSIGPPPLGPNAAIGTSILVSIEGTATGIEGSHSFIVQIDCESSLCVGNIEYDVTTKYE